MRPCRQGKGNRETVRSLRPIDEKILKEFALCRFLTIQQIKTRFFSKGSYTHVSTLLKRLAEEKYLVCFQPAVQSQSYLYGLGKKGVSYLRSIGVDLSYFPSEHIKLPSSLHLPHLLATNNILLAAALFCEQEPEIALIERRHYLTSRQTKRPVTYDAWIHFLIDGASTSIWVEFDRNTEEQKRIRGKTQAIIDFAMRDYLAEFGAPLSAIAFITTGGKHRLSQLKQWTQQELRETGQEHIAAYFRFACMPDSDENALELFTSPLWHSMESPEPDYLF